MTVTNTLEMRFRAERKEEPVGIFELPGATLEPASAELQAALHSLIAAGAAACGVPMGVVSVMEESGRRLTVSVGVDSEQTATRLAFCAQTMQQAGTFVVEDAGADARFAGHPVVTGEPGMRFYAGVPVLNAGGRVMGAACVADTKPRQMTAQQLQVLGLVGQEISTRLELENAERERAATQAELAEARAETESIAKRLRASEALFQTFMDNSPMASFIKDGDGRFVFCSTRYAEVFGLGTEVYPRLGGAGRAEREDGLGAVAREDAKSRILERTDAVRGKDGTETQWRSFQFPCRGEDGRALLGCVAMEITGELERNAEIARYQVELEQANDRLRNEAVTDDLTGLRNRRAFEERLRFEFSMARRKVRELAVVLIDADDFKKVNDRLGHAAGDSVLQQLAKVLHDTVRLTDLPVRFGGEEFAIILTESDEQSALAWCKRLQGQLAATRWLHVPVTVSMGVAGLTPACVDGSHLVAMADQALYRAKRQGKNRFVGAGEIEKIERTG